MQGRSSWRHGAALGLVVSFTLAIAVSSLPANAAAAITISGTVRCPSGAKVVGVWVQSSGGGSKFASRSGYPGNSTINGYSASVNPGSVELHIGCGGSEASWASDQYTTKVTASSSRNLNATCSGPAGTFRKVACAFPARPNLAAPSTNTFAGGNCTWYAADKWRKATGKYPSWSGNAQYWNNNAKGWTVTSVPAPRSVVVFEPGIQGASKDGHVAWVESVSYRSDGWYLNVSEMNFTGFNRVSTRTVKHVSGMSYIWAPG
ncbi:MAG TPA: CHAP domain-containing protein [Solirubrobacterales bacterium]